MAGTWRSVVESLLCAGRPIVARKQDRLSAKGESVPCLTWTLCHGDMGMLSIPGEVGLRQRE